jgi:hypothetical protein
MKRLKQTSSSQLIHLVIVIVVKSIFLNSKQELIGLKKQKPVKTMFYELFLLKDIIYVGAARFELATSCSQSRRDNRATLRPDP